MGDVIEVSQVTVRRGATELVKNLDFSVNEGERWVVLGPNGAGKTTLVQLISARLYPSEGSVELLGERLGEVAVDELRPFVGVCSAAIDQRIPSSQKVMTVVATAAYGQLARGREVYEEADLARARELLAEFGVEALAERPYRTLSTGEKKRVAIARALMSDPEILILDEPAAGLDLAGREQVLAALTRLAASPAAPVLVLVTHHVEEIPPGFTHLMLMRDGHAAYAGPITQVLSEETLSDTFGMPLRIVAEGGRFTARAK